ncbi:MAG: response regulator [Bdellovibrio sp.]|nr:MAG: response regulator [Bdellovibrio sp.]
MGKKVNTKDFVKKIEHITRQRIAKSKVVSLKEYKKLQSRKKTPTLLIIEDDETMRKSFKRLFEEEGYHVITAADGTQLSSLADNTELDLILLDVGLPWINGFELAQLMKEHDDLKDIPLIFVSGRTDPEDLKRGFAVGADDYIKKPFDLEKIKKSVRVLLELNNSI